MTIKSASLGSISTATLKTNDLLSAFISEMEWQISCNGNFFSMPENFALRDTLNNLVSEAQDCFAEDGEEIDEDKEGTASELISELGDAFSEHFAPPYCYFGCHPGDGADFGFWPDIESVNELPAYDDTESAKEAGETGDFRVVSDHGNVEVYSSNGTSIIGFV